MGVPPTAGSQTTIDAVAAWTQSALESLGRLAGVRRVGLALTEGGGRRLRFTGSDRDNRERPAWCHVDAYDDVPLNTAVRTGRVVVGSLAELGQTHPAFIERQRKTGTHALAAVPFVGGRRTLGGFLLFYRQLRSFGGDEVERLTALGAELGQGLHDIQARPAPQPDGWGAADPAPGARVVQFSVSSDPAAVGPARHELRVVLRGWDLDGDAIERATLCLSELVTNAVVHAASGSWVRVTNDAGTVLVTVRSPGSPLHELDAGADDPLQ